jgi:hypothetical protein
MWGVDTQQVMKKCRIEQAGNQETKERRRVGGYPEETASALLPALCPGLYGSVGNMS